MPPKISSESLSYLCEKNMTKYNQETVTKMQLYFSQLNEKEKRHYAATEATKLGYGGQQYIIEILGVSDHIIRRGIRELSQPELLAKVPKGKIRQPGGGRKKKKIVKQN